MMNLAVATEQRSTCLRAKVGCVLAHPGQKNRVLSLGYVGSEPGQAHCFDEGCVIGATGGCVRTTHAEANAISWAESLGLWRQLIGCTAYVTLSPCVVCAQRLVDVGCTRVVYMRQYRLRDGLVALEAAGVETFYLPMPDQGAG